MDYWPPLVLWLVVTILNHDVSGVTLTALFIDKYTIRGHDSLMVCRYDLQGDTLYSVKWYKDGHEFYRYVPRDSPVTLTFPVPGVTVNLEQSNETQVLLERLTLDSSGRYRCEVSAEAPTFQTASNHQDMVTVALPERGPVITGGRPRYNIGDVVNVNCTSGSSQPAAHLAWFINGDQVNSSYLRGPVLTPVGEEGLETTTLGLQFHVEPRHFYRGDLKLKCLATIATVYWNSNEESVVGEKPYRPPVLEVKDTSRADRVRASTTVQSSSARLQHHVLLIPTAMMLILLLWR